MRIIRTGTTNAYWLLDSLLDKPQHAVPYFNFQPCYRISHLLYSLMTTMGGIHGISRKAQATLCACRLFGVQIAVLNRSLFTVY